jgi:predicted DCC family thiol-disulfide oxidoreductase YuxK
VPPASALRRDSATLVFDGDCGFCTSAVTWLEHRVPALPAIVPYQWAPLEELGLTPEEAAERVWLVAVDDDGLLHQYGGHLAVSVLLRHQPRLGWRFLGILLDTPPFSLAADLGYRLVARYRYLLPGGTPACRVGRTP